MANREITQGDTPTFIVTLSLNGTVFAIPGGSVVRVGIVHTRGTKTLDAGPVTVTAADPGADWPNGVVAVAFSSAQTAALTPRHGYELEIEVNDAGDIKTWHADSISVIEGLVV